MNGRAGGRGLGLCYDRRRGSLKRHSSYIEMNYPKIMFYPTPVGLRSTEEEERRDEYLFKKSANRS
jgi:hypothetical protein